MTISNDGVNEVLTINGIQVLDDFDSAFLVESLSFPIELAPGESRDVEISFNPGSATGIFSGILEIDTDGKNQPIFELPLSASVFDPVAVVTPEALDFGDFVPNPGAQTLELTIANDGTSKPLTIVDIIVFDDPDGVFSVGSFPNTVAPGASTKVTISFDPSALDGYFSGSLEIETNGENQEIFEVPLSAGVNLADPGASLVSLFTFDDEANLGDDSGSYDNDGTAVGDAQQSTASRIGTGALQLDGDGDLIELSGAGDGEDYTSGLIANFEGFTAACWAIIPTEASGDVSRFFSTYLSGEGTMDEGWGVGLNNTTLLSTTYSVRDYWAAPDTAPARGSWHHFAYVLRNDPLNQIDYYIDGALVDSVSSTQTGMNPATTLGFAIGALGDVGARIQFFEGRIDDLRIYERELLAANIADLYNSAPPLSGYDAWADSFGLDPAGNGAPDQDVEPDGLENELEFMLGSSPIDGTQSNLPVGTNGDDTYTYTYQRETEATAAGFIDSVEFGTNLVDWTSAENGVDGVTITITTIDADTEEVVVTIPVNGANKWFVRLVVTAP